MHIREDQAYMYPKNKKQKKGYREIDKEREREREREREGKTQKTEKKKEYSSYGKK